MSVDVSRRPAGAKDLTSFDWRLLRMAAELSKAGTLGLAIALETSEETVIASARRLEAAGFLTLVVNE